MVLRLLPALLLVPLLAFAPSRASAQLDPCDGDFTLSTADTLGAVGAQSAIAVDAQGRAHVAYRNVAGTQIRYADEQENGGWAVDLVPQQGFLHGVSLALAPDGSPWLGYGAQEDTPIGIVVAAKVAHRVGDRWITERIEPSIPTDVAVAFDPAGTLHAVYFSYIPAFVIRYASLLADGWHTETAFATGGLGAGRFSLAFDSQSRPHITAQVSLVLLHIVRGDAGWVVDKQPAGEGASLVLDASDVPHVATHVRVPPSVQYRSRGNGVWNTEIVDTVDAGPNRSVSLALDRFGRPFLAYWDVASGALKVAWKQGASWRRRVLDAGGAGEGPAVALAGGERPRVSSMDPVSFDLRIAEGSIPPPNRAPTADAGGPYAATVAQEIAFDATRSADPDGDALAYEWSFGDGARAVGSAPVHRYAAAGTYHVCAGVHDHGCPPLQDSACAEASVVEALALRAFRANDRKIELTGTGPKEGFLLEPVDQNFPLGDLDPSTLRAGFGPASASPEPTRVARLRDSDGNGVLELPVAFDVSALTDLFEATPEGKSEVTMDLLGTLRGGARVRGSVTFPIQKHRDCRDGCAEVAPNPMNPDAALRFTLARPGIVSIELFDAQGRSVELVRPPSYLSAGPHEARLSSRALASGIYFYRIRTPDGSLDGRFSILK